jgi:hypothetical protein
MHHLNSTFVQLEHVVRHVSSCDKRTSYIPCLQLLLTVSAGRVTINILPDDVLLLIFHFDRATFLDRLKDYVDRLRPPTWRWHRLVHVCQRWRSIVLASPIALDLTLVWDPWTPIELTSIWPPFPIIIRNNVDRLMPEDYDFDPAIVHPNRVREIYLFYLTSSQLQRLASAMQEQFSTLIHLELSLSSFHDVARLSPLSPAPALPDGFLGGSVPHLQSLELDSIPFPALPKFLLSATDLVRLTLLKTPHSGYISPEAIVTGLAVMANLKSVNIGFESPLSRPDQESRRPPPQTRITLPALTHFEFKGASEYLEVLVSLIDAPLLDSIRITFFHQLIFDIPQLAQFMRHATRFQTLNEAHVSFEYGGFRVGYLPQNFDKSGLEILSNTLDWQLSSLVQVITSFFSSIHMVEHLYIYGDGYLPSQWRANTESMQWLEMFHLFPGVRNLYVSKKVAKHIALALQELIGDRTTDVLPILQNIFSEVQPSGPIQEGIGKFVAARQLSGHPITVSLWERYSEQQQQEEEEEEEEEGSVGYSQAMWKAWRKIRSMGEEEEEEEEDLFGETLSDLLSDLEDW